jgi:DNA polymerase I-like protein with 3'-5' exonuclease and polymerase domains
VTDWARGLIDQLAGSVPPADLTVLRGQVTDLLQSPTTPPAPDPTVPEIVRSADALARIAAELAAADAVAIDLETSGRDPAAGEIVGVGLAAGDRAWYLPVAHRLADTKELLPDQVPLTTIVTELGLGRLPLVAHNAQFELKWLRTHAGVTPHFTWDTMLAARLARSDLPVGLKEVAARELDAPDWGLSNDEMKRIQYLPIDKAARYCAKDVVYTLDLMRRQQTWLS